MYKPTIIDDCPSVRLPFCLSVWRCYSPMCSL